MFSVDDMRTPPAGYFTSRWGEPEYTDWLDEQLSWKRTCYLGDWSFLWQHWFRGPDALRLISDFTVNSFASFDIGSSKHAIHTDQNGKVIHEGVLTRFGPEEFMVHGRGGWWLRHQLEHGSYRATVEQDDWFILQVTGPTAIKLLRSIDPSDDLLVTPWMHVTDLQIAGHRVHALRQGMSGEPGFELQGPVSAKADVVDALLEAGAPFGIRRLGGRTAPINHLEAGYPTIATDYIPAIFAPESSEYLEFFLAQMPAFATPAYIAGSYPGVDVAEYYRSPIELGWASVVNPDHEFLGRDALVAEKSAPRRVLRTLEWNADDVAAVLTSILHEGPHPTFMELPRDQRGFVWADRVERDGRLVGVATSRGYSYHFRKMLSLATIDVEHAAIGTPLTVIWGNPGDPEQQIRATVAPSPYKAGHARENLRAFA